MEIEDKVVEKMQQEVEKAKGWMTFLGIMSIISGALTAISIVGIIIAWLPIWMGVILVQAGSRGKDFIYSKDFQYLSQMLSKLRLYFIIAGIMIIVSIVIAVISWIFMLAGGLAFLRQFGFGY